MSRGAFLPDLFCHFLPGNGNMCASIFSSLEEVTHFFYCAFRTRENAFRNKKLFFAAPVQWRIFPPTFLWRLWLWQTAGQEKLRRKKEEVFPGENSCCEKRGHENCRSSTYFFCAKCGKLLCPSTNAHGKKRKFQVLTLRAPRLGEKTETHKHTFSWYKNNLFEFFSSFLMVFFVCFRPLNSFLQPLDRCQKIYVCGITTD